MIDFEAWVIDVKRKSATHESGYSLVVEGSVKDPSAVNPGRVPKGLSAHDQVRLLRIGLEKLASSKESSIDAETKAVDSPVKKTYQRPANLPRKPLLSLKKRS